jgi:hypothetical protein
VKKKNIGSTLDSLFRETGELDEMNERLRKWKKLPKTRSFLQLVKQVGPLPVTAMASGESPRSKAAHSRKGAQHG